MLNSPKSKEMLTAAETYKSNISADNKSFSYVFHILNKINDDNVYIYRFEENGKIGTCNMFHPHVTVIVDDNKILRGYHHIDQEMVGENKLQEEKCIELSKSFLQKYAKDLIDGSLQYISNLKFPVIAGDGRKHIVNAKWVKYREAKTGSYFWVVIDPRGNIIEFDRDIFWNFFRGARVTEEWLLDDWLTKWLNKQN